ncbi:MAG: TIGR01212 family radical SAM protein [Bacillota bacterium]|nr:TIGR01212 family radical SAM protein [Bacillota bacterium]
MGNEMNGEPIIFDTRDGQELRINMISPWLKEYFGSGEREGRSLKIAKLSLDGGFTCPNRDGSKGFGGCCFCSESGSGDMASTTAEGVQQATQRQIELLSHKWPKEKYDLKYIAYFQNHTNTYGSVEKMRVLFEAALEVPGVEGLAVATRSDCISHEVLELLEELNKKTLLWVELGLQTIHKETAEKMNLCHEPADYRETVGRLAGAGIRIVTHLILGLPGETREMMLKSVSEVCRPLSGREGEYIFGLKLHMLNVVRGSRMAVIYPDYVPFETMEDYIDLLIEALEIIPPEITMHRISGDAPRSTLIAPAWSYRKRAILNSIHREMRVRNTWQGRLYEGSAADQYGISIVNSL